MYTYQDFTDEKDVTTGMRKAIIDHKDSETYKTAVVADLYDAQRNKTINEYVHLIWTLSGSPVEDFTASNNKIPSNFFSRLNTQRMTYSLGNGISFTSKEYVINEDGVEEVVDTTKEKLGEWFDKDMADIAYYGLIHGVSFGFWNVDRLHCFKVTEFAPLYDEETGALRAGVRFWQLTKDKPLFAVLYEEDGYTKYRAPANSYNFEEIQTKRAYKQIVAHTEAGGDAVIGEENYSALPVVPFYGSRLKQSTLIGMREKIDSFDLIRSGFANDLTDCAQIYWILENCSGMSDAELAKFRDRLKINHIAVADTINSKATPYTQDIPFQARQAYLDSIRAGIYEDFGGLDVHTIAAGATNDHIDAAYQPMDENADDFEYQILEFIQQVLSLMGIVDTPIFKRNRISNQAEQTQMVLSAAEYLDDETILNKLPFITVDEVAKILAAKDEEADDRYEGDEEGLGGDEDDGLDAEFDSLEAELEAE